MAIITEHKLDGVIIEAYREIDDVTISADFGLNAQAVLDLDSITFVDTQNSLNSTMLRDRFRANPAEGAVYSFTIIDTDDPSQTYTFDFFTDWSKLEELSDVETKVGLIKKRSLESLIDTSGEDTTMTLLIAKGALIDSDFIAVPYIIENRKSRLEKVQLVHQVYSVVKSGIDEGFKIYNIVADISSVGIILALVNLAIAIADLALITLRLRDLYIEARDSFYPPIRFHNGISLKTYFTKAIEYLGYEVAFGSEWTELDGLVLLGSKNSEIGTKDPIVTAVRGKFKPSDFGYTLKELFELSRKLANTDIAIIGNTVHIKPRKDPFWTINTGFVMSSTLIEQSPFVQNGSVSYNYEDAKAGFIIEAATDDSDYWTLQTNSIIAANRIFSVTTTPLSFNDLENITLRGIKLNKIPYCLGVRNTNLTDFIFAKDFELQLDQNLIKEFNSFYNGFRKGITSLYQSLPGIDEDIDPIAILTQYNDVRQGALKIENHFFSVPKILYMVPNSEPQLPNLIPTNFKNFLDVDNIYNNYFKYDSLVPEVRNPDDANDTAGKRIHKEAKIEFKLKDFNSVLNNSYFSSDFGTSKFTKVKWKVKGDFAIVDFWVQDAWLTNVEETYDSF